MYLNRFVSSRYQSLVCIVRPKICRFKLIVCQVQVVRELWRIILDQWLIPIIIRWWSSNSSLGHVLVVKVSHGLVLILTKSCYTELLLQYRALGTRRKHSHQWLKLFTIRNMYCYPTFSSGSSEMVFIWFD